MKIYINNSIFIIEKKDQKKTLIQILKKFHFDIPRFCFHEELQIAGNCRMCLIEIKNSPKPVASCAMPIINEMSIFTDSPLVKKARESVLEFLLLNHPLDCPICDQGGECDLQDQTLFFGNEKSRFFESKRVVEDKNCGPFIKTIMTRCIHCTRCVRFSNEIAFIDGLGTVGRGNTTEISFYLDKIFLSELSGNVIDLCPVGALTSKPYAFKARPWELKKKDSIDILDNMGTPIKINIQNNEIIRILPNINRNINYEWITNKTRFFFDSLKYQRITQPLLKNSLNYFSIISWKKAFTSMQIQSNFIDQSEIQFVCGQLIDTRSLFAFKSFMNLFGFHSNIFFEEKKEKINNNYTSDFYFNNRYKNIQNSDLIFLIGCNPKKEANLLNVHLKKKNDNNSEIFYIGSKINFNFPTTHIGSSLTKLKLILEGKHFINKFLKISKKIYIILGSDFIKKNDSYIFFKNIKNKFSINNFFFNILHEKSSFLSFNEIIKNNYLIEKKIKMIYLFNTENYVNKINNFIVYQGHHFTNDAQKAHLVLPGSLFFEKNSHYINLEGYIFSLTKVFNFKLLKDSKRDDFCIIKNYINYLFLKKNLKKNNLSFSLLKVHSYLIKKKIYIISSNEKYNTSYFFIKNPCKNNGKFNILKNTFEKFSKILNNSLSSIKATNWFSEKKDNKKSDIKLEIHSFYDTISQKIKSLKLKESKLLLVELKSEINFNTFLLKEYSINLKTQEESSPEEFEPILNFPDKLKVKNFSGQYSLILKNSTVNKKFIVDVLDKPNILSDLQYNLDLLKLLRNQNSIHLSNLVEIEKNEKQEERNRRKIEKDLAKEAKNIEKERVKQEKILEKERVKQEKILEKEKIKQEKILEKEKIKQEKILEKERIKQEKIAEKIR